MLRNTDISMHFSLSLAVLPLVLSQAHALDRCPDGWMEAHGGINLGCLHFGHPEDQQMTHEDAKAYCAAKNEDAYLVEVRTAVQQTFLDLVMNLMMEGAGVETSTWWNGATNGGEDGGDWFWEGTGEAMVDDGTAGTWQDGEPMAGAGSCAVMESSAGFTWRATECSDMAGVVCQLDAPPA